MSRIGKKPILIPEKIEVTTDKNKIIVKGPKGEIQKEIPAEIRIEIKEKQIRVLPFRSTKKTNALWGLFRALISNLIKGVSEGYEKKLQIEGIGYKAVVKGEELVLEVGFSHPIKIKQPEGIKFLVEKNIITISGIDKELVGQLAAKIRAVKPPEVYKGKGIRYLGELVRRKEGKKEVVTAGG